MWLTNSFPLSVHHALGAPYRMIHPSTALVATSFAVLFLIGMAWMNLDRAHCIVMIQMFSVFDFSGPTRSTCTLSLG